ncbi:MAG: right-handed parallel beta-helix repeat-containing protein [Thermonemataceae bacterium]
MFTIKKWVALSLVFLGFMLTSCHKDSLEEILPQPNREGTDESNTRFSGTVFYVDPANGRSAADGGRGTREKPWKTLQQVLNEGLIECYDKAGELINAGAPAKGGDKLLLKTGFHGAVYREKFVFRNWLTIEAAEGNTPVLSHIDLTGAAAKIHFKGLSVIKSRYQGDKNWWEVATVREEGNGQRGTIIKLAKSHLGKPREIKFTDLLIRSTEKENTDRWSVEDWRKKAQNGIDIAYAEKVTIEGCTVKDVGFGIRFEYFTHDAKVTNNYIKRYARDGMRIAGDRSLIAYNTIKQNIDLRDGFHYDAIQAYTRDPETKAPGEGVIRDVKIIGNRIFGNGAHPLGGNPQGMGFFDGMYENWLIENNIVVSSTYHEITLLGARGCKVVNNTVLDQIPGLSRNAYGNMVNSAPWIEIGRHKHRSEIPNNNVIANNITSYSVKMADKNRNRISNNYVIGKDDFDAMSEIFINSKEDDYRLNDNRLTRERLIDKGAHFNNLESSNIDIDKRNRTNIPDIGAYERLW